MHHVKKVLWKELRSHRELKVPYDGDMIHLILTCALGNKSARTRKQLGVCELEHYRNLSQPGKVNVSLSLTRMGH